MPDDQDRPARPDHRRGFIAGAGQGFVLAFFLIGLFTTMMVTNRPELYSDALIVRGVLFGLAGVLIGGIRGAWLARHKHWGARIAIGGSLGAILGGVVGAGFMVTIGGPGEEFPWYWAGWCAGCVGFVLALRPLQHEV